MDYKKITSASTADQQTKVTGLMDKIKLNSLEYKSPLYSAPVSLRNQRRFPLLKIHIQEVKQLYVRSRRHRFIWTRLIRT